MSNETITRIKAAVDMGLTVSLAKSSSYIVIKDSIGQYLIKFTPDRCNYIGLHGMAGTKYEDHINMGGDWIVSGTITAE
jgi:hypothetical protein